MTVEKYLNKIDEVINNGKYKDTWESLSQHGDPTWYKKAKFGIFIHWGVYSVPAFGNEWYPRNMYLKGTKEFEHHIKTYGPQKEFGYADFVPMFKAEKFDPKAWVKLFKESGAKYIMPVAEHHDGFQMYDSELSDWNAKKMGPKRDVLGELKKEIEDNGLVFCASSHRAENYFFMCGLRDFDSGLQDMEFQEPYGYAAKIFEPEDQHEATHDIHAEGPCKGHLENWLARTCELVDKYQPKVVWFDWWIQNLEFKPYLKKFAAYYYNRALEWGQDVAINYKFDAYAKDTAVFDVERGQLSDINPRFWQTDTAIAKNSWGYTENNDFKTPESIVCDIVDIVSKNGSMLLNVGPKPDGTITEEDTNVLKGIGQWLKVNGESIYDTTYWSTYGEGPTEIAEGAFTDTNRSEFTSEDIRFTYKAPYIYANVLKAPADNKVLIKSMKKNGRFFRGNVIDIELLGFDVNTSFEVSEDGLLINMDKKVDSKYPICFKIRID